MVILKTNEIKVNPSNPRIINQMKNYLYLQDKNRNYSEITENYG
jgi:hypothetical protein